MKTAIITVVIAITLLGASSLAEADIFELPLAAEGEYDFQDTWTTEFDLGVTFTEISNVYIDWSGTITGQEILNDGTIDAQFVATLYELDPHDYFARAYVQAGAATYPEPEPFELQSVFTSEDLSLLLDGQSSIEIWFGDISHPSDPLGLPSGALASATLEIEGTIVPEPGTIFFLAIGIVCVRAKHRNKSRQHKHV